MKKLGAMHAFITAIVYTFLYAFLIISDPGPGFQDSIIASFDFEAIGNLAAASFGIYFALTLVMFLLSAFLEKILKTDFLEIGFGYIGLCCLIPVIIAALAKAFGLVA